MKVMKWIAVAVMLFGFVFALGTIGESDLDLIGWNELIVRILCGLGMMCTGLIATYFIELKEVE